MLLKRLIIAGAVFAAIPSGALAAVRSQAAAVTSVGPRVGFSVDPDQVVFGGQLKVADIAPDLSFDPDLELGFGDDATVVALNFDLHYHLRIQDTAWRPYLGAGLGVNFVRVDLPGPFNDVSDTEAGGNLLFGATIPTRSGNQFFAEGKFGLGSDVPQFKLMIGWNFRL